MGSFDRVAALDGFGKHAKDDRVRILAKKTDETSFFIGSPPKIVDYNFYYIIFFQIGTFYDKFL
uniref:Uncharacterized protein n=1 Tax=Halalkalibacterium halodurans TaxID=86665 RepID=A0A0M0KD01_ALKHA